MCTTPTTWLNLSVHRRPWWYQFRCSGSSRIATSACTTGWAGRGRLGPRRPTSLQQPQVPATHARQRWVRQPVAIGRRCPWLSSCSLGSPLPCRSPHLVVGHILRGVSHRQDGALLRRVAAGVEGDLEVAVEPSALLHPVAHILRRVGQWVAVDEAELVTEQCCSL